ncbi:hypothetical protein SLS56_011682 [Neofusicoccum ribis]|uniref:Uncharacterized protein n=1 Tax=Neofusicoccum ribis TaxID=45134 RepID=A0ABR3SBX5_9PEZI
MANGMKEIVQRHAEMILRNRKIAAAAVKKIRYFFDFDRDASSVDAVLAVRVPLFALNAEDDPVRRPYTVSVLLADKIVKISHYEALPYEEFQNNPYTVLCTTSCGGHLGWYESGDQRWFAKPEVQVIAFLKALHHDIDWSKDFTSALHVPEPTKSFEYNPIRRRMQPAAAVYFPGQADPI